VRLREGANGDDEQNDQSSEFLSGHVSSPETMVTLSPAAVITFIDAISRITILKIHYYLLDSEKLCRGVSGSVRLLFTKRHPGRERARDFIGSPARAVFA